MMEDNMMMENEVMVDYDGMIERTYTEAEVKEKIRELEEKNIELLHECDEADEVNEMLIQEKENLKSEVEELRAENESYKQYCNNLATELQQVKEENFALMRKVLIYQDAELKQYRDMINNAQG